MNSFYYTKINYKNAQDMFLPFILHNLLFRVIYEDIALYF